MDKLCLIKEKTTFNPLLKCVEVTINNQPQLTKKVSENRYLLEDDTPSFVKFCPLVDPLKYLTGEYNKDNIMILPSEIYHDNAEPSQNKIIKKINDANNSAYVDAFFSYLQSTILKKYNFVNAVNFYGSFTALKQDYHVNITDDVDFLAESDYFINNNRVLYSFNENVTLNFSGTQKNKLPLEITNEIVTHTTDDPNNYDDLFSNNETLHSNSKLVEIDMNNMLLTEDNAVVFEEHNTDSEEESEEESEHISDDDGSNYSEASFSESNMTDEDNLDESDDLESECSESECSESECSESDYTDDEDEDILCSIKEFPVHVASLEMLENTLDNYINTNDVSNDEWKAILFQIIIILTTYQEKFDFIHNDLHTNNIMYNTTNQQYISYRLNGTIYTVPTYGKIYKIIDFGRSVYSYKNNTLFSDSFSLMGDANTQYNCEPYYNKNKKTVLPNKSFDMCRLGCSLFDYFFDHVAESRRDNLNEIESFILFLCLDDHDKNILYKSSNRDRFPEFKLYKMIARIVHNKVPSILVNHTLFKDFKDNKHKTNNIIDIDAIPRFS